MTTRNINKLFSSVRVLPENEIAPPPEEVDAHLMK
jgi:hypothetical protein